MQANIGISEVVGVLLLAATLVVYTWNWLRLRRALPTLATRPRLLAFSTAMLALTLALFWPLPDWSNYLLAMRSIQKVLVCMVAAPLIWLAVPVHVLVWGIRGWARRAFVRLNHQGRIRSIAKFVTQPMVAWFGFVAAFLFWHDPSIANFLIAEQSAHIAAPWFLLAAALLFWWPVVDAGPRLHRHFPAWLLIVYLISVEVANMVAGVTIAFSSEPLYPHYPALRAQLAPDALPWSQAIDQIAGGAIVWVFGSFVYFSSVVVVMHGLFRKEGSTAPIHLPNWDDHEKFIAPGLEQRAAQNKFRNADLNHH